MYLLAKFGGQKSYRNGDVNYCINFHMNTLEKAELTASISHIERFSKSEIPILKSKTRLVEKQEEEEESVMHLTQTQKT